MTPKTAADTSSGTGYDTLVAVESLNLWWRKVKDAPRRASAPATGGRT